MKNALFLIVAIVVFASCSAPRMLPSPPSIDGSAYYDSTYVKLRQEAAFNAAAKKERSLKKPHVTMIGATIFGVYCILAWRFDIE